MLENYKEVKFQLRLSFLNQTAHCKLLAISLDFLSVYGFVASAVNKCDATGEKGT